YASRRLNALSPPLFNSSCMCFRRQSRKGKIMTKELENEHKRAFPGQIEAFCRSRFSSGQRRLAKGIPLGTSEPIASDPGGKMPGPSGWLKRAG
ncbi:hypothetical protein, partial [Rhizobium leguminosarum]|uniref:hypothetical protein n=1 Tax=Rhizobium leguminosarum TaxID=384 RepID=UPI001952E8FD